jgi:hypothetical protein
MSFTQSHPTDAEIIAFVSGNISKSELDAINLHIMTCPDCEGRLAEAFADAWEREGDNMWAEYVGAQLLSLFSLIPEEDLGPIMDGLGIQSPAVVFVGVDSINLPILQLDAFVPEGGYGFYEQHIRTVPVFF